jgi:hypothetical protein
VADHVLSDAATSRAEADTAMSAAVTPDLLREVLALVPSPWLADEPGFATADDVRAAYVDHLSRRLAVRDRWRP